MADEFNSSTNWWDSSNSSRNRFESRSNNNNNNNNNNPSSNSSSSSGLNNTLGSFSWPTAELMVDHVKPRSSLDHQSSNSNSVADSGPADLHLMGLGLSSQAIHHWNQSLFRGGEKSDGSNFRLIENYQQQESGGDMNNNIGPSSSSPSSQVHQWRERVLGFSLDHQQFSPHGSSTDSTVTCQGLQSSSNFQQMDNISPSIYACGSPATLLQGLVLAAGSPSDQENQTQQAYNPYGQNYDQFLPPSSSSSWSKVPNKQTPHQLPHSHLHFSNNAPFWNASASSNINDVRPSYFQPLQPQFPASSFDEKPKNISDVRDSNTVVKKSGGEGGGGGGAASTAKRPRNETPSTLPAFKVRKEKMGDRITALQQLVSPFGKTDTASVLSEAIEYIKFLHEQVSVLSTPYMKSGAAIHHHHQNSDHKSKDGEGQKQDLRSRGLCLVPVSSTFPMTHETSMDIWTPTYGGTFR